MQDKASPPPYFAGRGICSPVHVDAAFHLYVCLFHQFIIDVSVYLDVSLEALVHLDSSVHLYASVPLYDTLQSKQSVAFVHLYALHLFLYFYRFII